MQYITLISRWFVGVLFIISGLIKANDALGFSYKLEEYFSADVLNMEFLMPYALLMAAGICIFEIVLGVMVLIGARPKFTTWSLLGMIVFFTFLTFYSAYFNKVTDCGCFGDAVKLTPWESFGKDIILLFFIGILFIRRKLIKPMLSLKMENMLLAIVSFFCFAFVIHTYNHLPYKDFRPYAVGKDLVEGMKTCDELGLPCEEVAYFYQVKDKTTGEELEITSKAYQENWENYDFIASSDKTIILQEGYEAPIHDFSIELDGADYTYSILDEPKAFLLITYNINKAEVDIQPEVNAFAAQCDAAGIPFVAISASIDDDLQAFKEQTNTTYPFYYMDETALKTIIRSNPGLLMLEKGVVKAKWHHNDFPVWEELQ
jgi:uncharacterized membrane protein YphA (DoxX/SURF4 family)